MYDYKSIFKEIMCLREAPDESLNDFHDCFIQLHFEFYEDDIDLNLMKEKLKLLLHISMNPKENESFQSIPTYIGYEAL